MTAPLASAADRPCRRSRWAVVRYWPGAAGRPSRPRQPPHRRDPRPAGRGDPGHRQWLHKLGVAITDLRNGAVYGYNPAYASQSASMAKPMIVLMAQRRARATGTPLTAEQLTRPPRRSPSPTTTPRTRCGAFAGCAASAYDELAAELEMTDTHADEARSESWSWTRDHPGAVPGAAGAAADRGLPSDHR